MLEFFKKLFSARTEQAVAPYKVEAPVVTPAVKPAKKPAVKKAAARPRKPRTPKA
jgi:hypothetical protein